MADKGGPTAQAGINYQNQIATLFLGRMIDPGPWPKNEEIIEVRNEDPTAEVDDVVVRYRHHTEWIQVKWSMGSSGKTWIKFWKHMIAQRWGKFGESDRLVLVIGQAPDWVKHLKEICGRAYGASRGPELATREQQVKEWQDRLSKSQKTFISDLVEYVSGKKKPRNKSEKSSTTEESNMPETDKPIPEEHLQPEALFELFSHMEVWTQYDPNNIKVEHGRAYVPKATLEWFNLFDKLFKIAGDYARSGKSISRNQLIQELKQTNIFIIGSISLIPFAAGLAKRYIHRRGTEIPLVKCLRRKPNGSAPRIIGLVGNGGFGKTDLAKAAANDPRVLKKYPDGVLWIELGQTPDLRNIIQNQITALTGKSPGFVGMGETGLNEAATALADELRSRKLLIVLDDVWQKKHLEYFLPGAVQSAILVTTRLPETVPPDGVVNVNEMENWEAARLLISWMEVTPHDMDPFSNLAKKLGEWPLLVNLAAGILEDNVRIDNLSLDEALSGLQERLDFYGLTAFDRTDEKDRRRAISINMNVSLERLENLDRIGNVRPRYLELAIFPEETDIPFAAIERLWKATAGMERIPAEDALKAMYRLSLFNRYDARSRTLRLHDVIRAYLEEQVKDELPDLHGKLLDGYELEDWTELPTNDYMWRRLAVHMGKAHRNSDLYNLISKEWMLAKLKEYHSHQSFADDVELAIQVAEEENDIVQLIRCCLIYATLGTLATDVPPEALGILAQCGQAERALGYAALIQDASKKASAFMMIGEAMIDKGETEEAKDLLFEALEEVEKIKNRIGFLDLQKKIIWTLTKAGAVEQALEATEAVEDDLAKADLVCKAVSATTQVGQINSVYRAMAIAEGVKDDLAKYIMLHCLATAITRSEEKDILMRVLAAVKSIKDKFWRANTLTYVSRAMIEMGEKDEAINVAYQALAVVDVIEEDSKKSSALSSITRALASVRDKDGLTGALAIATAIENKSAKAAALIDVGIALAQLGEHNQSEAAKEEAVVAALEAEDTVRALSYVAGQLIGGSDMVRAADSLNMILAAVKEIQNPVNKLDVLLMLVQSWVIIGDKDRAAKLASRALVEIEAIGDEINKSRRLSHMVQALVRTGQNEDLNRAVAIAAELKNKHGQAQALSRVAQVLASNQKFDQASVVVMRINDPLERANALVQMAQVLAQTKQTLPAIESNKQALASLETIDDATVTSSTKVSVRVRIAWLFAQVGEIETAAGIVNQILDSAEAAGQAKSDSYRPKGVAKALAKAKRFNKAIEVTDSIGGELYRMEAMARVAQGLAEIGEQQRVKEVSEQILEIVDNLDNGPAKAEVLIESASALAQVGEIDLAVGVASQAVVVAENMLEDLINNHPVNQKGLILVEIILENVINFLARVEETQKALELADKVYSISNELVGARPSGGALVFLAKALILTGNKNRAAEYLDKAIISAEEKEEGLNKYSEFASIAQVHMQLGEISKATDLASEVLLAAGKISDELLGPRSIGQAASILVYADKLEQALVVLDKIQGYSSKEIVLDYIIRSLIQKGDFDKAAELDEESYGMVERIDDRYEKSLKLKRLAQRMTLANRQEQALQFLLSAFLTARFGKRSTVLDMLDGGAEILAEIDKGTTLWRSFEAVTEVDSWRGTE